VPCQDEHRCKVIASGGSDVLIIVVADGAGSARLSDQGSRVACEGAIEVVSRFLRSGGDFKSVTNESLHLWADECSEYVAAHAAALEATPRDLACTLLLAVVAPDRAAFAQLGDGAIVASINGDLRAVFWPQTGQFANSTFFLTDAGDRSELMTHIHEGAIDKIALLSDGLQLLALDYASREPHAPFFNPMFERLRETAHETRALVSALEMFLTSPAVRARTDDDLTLVMATTRSIVGATNGQGLEDEAPSS
jgi:hypothetical protein